MIEIPFHILQTTSCSGLSQAKGIAPRPGWARVSLPTECLQRAPTCEPHLAGLWGGRLSHGSFDATLDIPSSPCCLPGDDDGPPSEDHFLHCRHREHRCADGPQADAPLQLPGERGSLPPIPGWKKAVQDDLPRLWIWGRKGGLPSVWSGLPLGGQVPSSSQNLNHMWDKYLLSTYYGSSTVLVLGV